MPGAGPASGDDLLSTIGIAMRAWPGVAGLALTGTLCAWFYVSFVAVPVYTAAATLVLESRPDKVVDLDSVVPGMGGDQTQINTEVQVLKAHSLAARLASDLNLHADPEFNPYLNPSPRDRILGLAGIDATAPTEAEVQAETVRRLQQAVTVTNLRQSFVFELSVATHDPAKSARIANRLAELYVLDQIEVKFERTQQATQWLTVRVTELKDDLERAEAQLKTFDSNAALVSRESLEAQSRQLKELRERRTEVEARVAEARNQAEARRLETHVQGFDRAIAELETRIAEQSAELVTLEQLSREAEANRLIYEYFLGRLKETRVQQGIQQADARVLSPAVEPVRASSPRVGSLLALATVAGFLLGAFRAVRREMRQTAFRTVEDLESATGLPVLGSVPQVQGRQRRRPLDAVIGAPQSALAESVRNLRTSLLLADTARPPKVIMVTSSVPAEGKTTVSLLLAQNLAAMGRKVLLIEGDLRRRVFGAYFGADSADGVVAVVTGAAAFRRVVHRDADTGIDVLMAESTETNPADFYTGPGFAGLLATRRRDYDTILIDTPPVLAVPDARIIAPHVDRVLYAVRWNITTAAQVRLGLGAFKFPGAPDAGLVLTQVDARKMRRYGYGGYGYADYGYDADQPRDTAA